LDLSARNPLVVSNFEVFSKLGKEIQVLDISENAYEYDLENKEFLSSFLEIFLLEVFFGIKINDK
jgi:hypothetical protein